MSDEQEPAAAPVVTDEASEPAKVEVIPEPSFAAFDTYTPPACGACGKGTTLRAACPDCGHSHEITDHVYKKLEATVHTD